jgi:hypothetical protein
MNKIYLIAPLTALAFFTAVYVHFHRGHTAREAAKVAQAQAARQAGLQAEQAARRQAIDEALRSQESRKKDREARETRDRADQELRQAALDARDRAQHEFDRLTRQLAGLRQELTESSTAIEKLNREAASLNEEKDFLVAFVERARVNARSLARLLEKLAAADDARAAAAANANKNS